MRAVPRLALLTTVLVVTAAAITAGMAGNAAQATAETHTIRLPLVYSWKGQAPRPMFGVNFISSAEEPADEQRYANARSTGATWNRWPIYWHTVEAVAGNFNWSSQDANIKADVLQGLNVEAILLGTPAAYTTSSASPTEPRPRNGPLSVDAIQAATPVGLYQPIFSDGTDSPEPGKQINPNNVWARFVYQAVQRYRPGGVLANQLGWPVGAGISHWEIWNEPDLDSFWDSSLEDYARLLKVAYLVIKFVDRRATVIFGGLANFQKPNFYGGVLALYAQDPLAPGHGYFHDVLATHNYANSWNSWYHVFRARVTMGNYGVNKPVWLNESGVAAWDDYPGPAWEPDAWWRATMTEQADFVVQSAFYAAFAGAEAVFHFQLYDDCGNQPEGTDFPPHNGELCGQVPDCAGDANGLFRNPPDALCFTQHPEPETPRPNYTAFRIVTEHLSGVQPLWRARPGGSTPSNGPQEWIAFYRPATQERIVGMWARFGSDETAVLPALADWAYLISPEGITAIIYPSNGAYTLVLPRATNQNYPSEPDPSFYQIGGRPYILVEFAPGGGPPP
jgi:hypothetical protein